MAADLVIREGKQKRLAEYVQGEAIKVEKAVAQALPHAINCGKGLIQLKNESDHGDFIGLIEANFSFTRQTASTYMRLARAAENKELEMEAALSISGALRQIAPPPTEEEVEEEIVEDGPVGPLDPNVPDPGPRVQCPTCGHMNAPENIGVWEDYVEIKDGICPTCGASVGEDGPPKSRPTVGIRKRKQQQRLIGDVVGRMEGIHRTMGEVDIATVDQVIPAGKHGQWLKDLEQARASVSALINAIRGAAN